MARAKSKAEETKKLSVNDKLTNFLKENAQYHYNFEDIYRLQSFLG